MRRINKEREEALILLSANSDLSSTSHNTALSPPAPPHSQVEALLKTKPQSPATSRVARPNHKQRRPGRRAAARRRRREAPNTPTDATPPPVDYYLLTDAEVRDAVINGGLASAVVDSGATTSCLKPLEEQTMISSCGKYEIKGAPFHHTGQQSNKIFQMALGSLDAGRNEVKMAINLIDAAREGHMIPGGSKTIFAA